MMWVKGQSKAASSDCDDSISARHMNRGISQGNEAKARLMKTQGDSCSDRKANLSSYRLCPTVDESRDESQYRTDENH